MPLAAKNQTLEPSGDTRGCWSPLAVAASLVRPPLLSALTRCTPSAALNTMCWPLGEKSGLVSPAWVPVTCVTGAEFSAGDVQRPVLQRKTRPLDRWFQDGTVLVPARVTCVRFAPDGKSA